MAKADPLDTWESNVLGILFEFTEGACVTEGGVLPETKVLPESKVLAKEEDPCPN